MAWAHAIRHQTMQKHVHGHPTQSQGQAAQGLHELSEQVDDD